ncbi:hypothetical protein BTN82_17875 [Pseudomonas chlororaphis]|uniref:TonB-dependent receptor plug domain-containing protein n=1 Tax=Pseudomonas chlororaphis TaxID=587753 RepID=A0A1Q8ENH2_9PSED|nr:hypothetical protein BTN82_17875 [Pseudomonas chlororaphis]
MLINGRRVADYPTAYGGQVNFTNLANIPSAVIDRIEVLSRGASAIYGSDAIAGVVNIILKEQASGIDVNPRGGTSFRAPDLNYIYQADTNGYTPDQIDYYVAARAWRAPAIAGGWITPRAAPRTSSPSAASPGPMGSSGRRRAASMCRWITGGCRSKTC